MGKRLHLHYRCATAQLNDGFCRDSPGAVGRSIIDFSRYRRYDYNRRLRVRRDVRQIALFMTPLAPL